MLEAFNNLYELIAIMATAVTLILALALGRAPERACGLILLIDVFGIILLLSLFDQPSRYWMVQVKAVLMLLAYGAVLWRWPHRWLIVLTALQAFAVLLHLAVWVDTSILSRVNALLLNGVGWLMMITLSAAAVGGAIQRYDARRAARQLPR